MIRYRFMVRSNDIAGKQKITDRVLHFIEGEKNAVTSIFILMIFGILILGIYSQTFKSPFAFDDIKKILENAHIRLTEFSPIEIVKAGIRSSKTRPIAFISFALNYYFNQYDLVGYHVVNILIHIFSGFLLFLFIRTTLGLPSLQYRYNRPVFIAFIASLIWLIHPVQTQSVTYIVQRMNSMASMLFILSFWLYVKGRLVSKGGKKWPWYVGSTLVWLVSLGCKQITVTLPFLVFLYEWYFFQDLSKDWFKRSLKWVLGITVIFILIALAYTGFKPWVKLAGLRDFALDEFTFTQRSLTQLRVVIYYISLLLFPHPSRLNLDYDFPLSYSLINPLTTLLCLIGIIGLLIVGILLAKKQRLMSFCIFWFFGNLLIESSVIPLAIIFEHRLYLPSMLVFLMFVILGFRYVKPEWLSWAIFCALILVCSYWTFERNKVWRDNVTLWTDTTKKSPNKARPYINLGKALAERKMYEEALPNYLKALQLNPNYVDAHHNLAALLEDKGETNEAIKHYRQALQINPNFEKSHNNLGLVLLEQDKNEEAINHFHIALQINPNFAQPHNNLGLALSKYGKINEAIEHYNKALKIDPKFAAAQVNLGNAMLMQGETELAINHFYKAVKIEPDYAEAHNNLGGHLLSQGKIEEARGHLVEALRLDPELAESHNNMGIILIQEGKLDAAILHFQDAVRINPEFTMAANNLKRALIIKNNLITETEKDKKD